MKHAYLTRILNAHVYDIVKQTSLQKADRLSERFGNQIYLKREDEQAIFCYKIRGAYNKMSQLTAAELKRGVVAASAGNHAQGVALSAQKLGCDATIVMPTTAPEIKQQAVKSYGAKVKLVGESYSDAEGYARTLCEKEGKVYVPPFDDPDVIAGQGTIGAEIVRQFPHSIDAIFIPIGGGGLISGVSAFMKAVRPEVKIIGVEPEDSNAMALSVQAGKRIELDEVGIFADGVAVKKVGEETFRLVQQYVDEIITVSTDEMCAAIKDIFEDTRSIMEPAGALAVAGAKRYISDNQVRNQNLITIASGANINFDRLRHVSERTEIGEGREAVLAVTIPEEPGSFLEFCRLIGKTPVTEFNYRYASDKQAHIFVGFQCADKGHSKRCVTLLSEQGYDTIDLSDNELAKVHGRHLVGGRAPGLQDERLFSFEFPERPGALLNFLEQISHRWNISLFHYRNHGSDFGRVLCGLQVPVETNTDFDAFLVKLGYRNHEVSDNPFIERFL